MQTISGRFAPSPTGPLHAGSLVAAVASWLDARALGGRWLVRIEDVDTPRCVAGAGHLILAQLAGFGLLPDEAPVWQSTRGAAYDTTLAILLQRGLAYPCACSRKDIDTALAAAGHPHRSDEERVYPGTCRHGLRGRPPRAVRLCLPADAVPVRWLDRRLGPQQQDVAREVGDFVLHRADGLWAYQLAVVVDDAWQGITHIVRGADLLDNTARQIVLQQGLGLPTPRYLHTPLITLPDGRKLSKQHGAPAITPGPAALREALTLLDMPATAQATADLLAHAVAAWRYRWFHGADSRGPGDSA